MIVSTFRKIVSDEREAVEIINEFAKQNDCTQENCGPAISSSLDWVEQFTNYAGNEITVSHRRSKGGQLVEFIIENSYKQSIKDQKTRSLVINND